MSVSTITVEIKAADVIRSYAEAIVKVAAEAGVVLTIEQRSIPPLAIGRYETIVSVRPAREAS